jgi:hypothetical protein
VRRRTAQPAQPDHSEEADRLAAQLDEVVKGRPVTEADFDALDRLFKLDFFQAFLLEMCRLPDWIGKERWCRKWEASNGRKLPGR